MQAARNTHISHEELWCNLDYDGESVSIKTIKSAMHWNQCNCTLKKSLENNFEREKKSPNENVPWKLNWLARTKPKRFEASCAIMHLHPLFTFANALLLSSLSSSFYSIDCSPYLSLQSPFMYHCPYDIDLLCAYIFIPLIQLPPPFSLIPFCWLIMRAYISMGAD